MSEKRDYTKGLNFWKWLLTPLNILVVSINLLLFSVAVATFDETLKYNPEWVAWATVFFNPLVLAIFTFKTWQHWNDLKNGTSR